jgi:hypothetical protein
MDIRSESKDVSIGLANVNEAGRDKGIHKPVKESRMVEVDSDSLGRHSLAALWVIGKELAER